jgi:hypothetical protein
MTPFVAAKVSPALPPLSNRKRCAVAKNQRAEVEVNRRAKSDRRGEDRRKENVPVASERRVEQRREKVQRRRQIDPTTCEREYNDEEIEFMHALDAYKRSSGRMFPTCSEILEVIRSLGYVRLTPAAAPLPPAPETEPLIPSEAL